MRKTDGLLKLIGLCLLAGGLVAGLLFPVVGGLGVMSNEASATVDDMSAELANDPPPLVTTITDADDEPIATLYDQYRIPKANDQISDAMKWALISVEDRRFYEHHGVDWKATMRAAITNQTGGDTQGASTLTQQYVKNYLINVVHGGDDPEDRVGQQRAQEQTIARKLQEARIAIQLENRMSKEQILTGYLNVVEFTHEIYGVGAAARSYFDTEAEDLTVPESALLAAMVINPAMLDPWKYPERAKERRDLVIDLMVRNRKLSEEDAEEAKDESLGVVADGPNRPPANCTGAGPEHGFFCQYVEDYLIESGIDREDLYQGGYTIKTTLERDVNRRAKESAEEQVDKTEDNVANTLSLVRPGTERREVVALAANKDYGTDPEKGQTSWALPSAVTNVTGAGSAYKIFTAAAALRERITGVYDEIDVPDRHVSEVFVSQQSQCPPLNQYGDKKYCVTNAEGADFPSKLSLQDALAQSPNTAFVILAEQAGMDNIVELASKLGMRRSMAKNGTGSEPDPESDNQAVALSQKELYGPSGNSPGLGSFTLGPAALSGLELANVGATILSDGVWCPPTPIREVVDRNGDTVDIEEQECEQAVDEDVADALADGLSKDHLPGGTAHRAASEVDWGERPMIGKTGTTQNNSSGAFLGATPQLSGGAMVFRPDRPNGGLCYNGPGNVHACDADDGTMFGGRTPAQTWFGAMSEILDGEDEEPIPEAPDAYRNVKDE
ncbi:Membrane carboxypeptidase (penicillin-binding protein) [Haloechinothrix alba]|uniref:Membrane carboxypeptidase (Penicillin-binding protein) n=1 Tax=Haloechinothrix alba TaxID=664784 RepID=A0A238XWX6_9PSEU|nr:transglycosylase domain-containing protein [Haloechinothrix alba]SNR63212.1 Membrane carboxypeptidase (penicillin-binding protein) [Haloechinothrix alba]